MRAMNISGGLRAAVFGMIGAMLGAAALPTPVYGAEEDVDFGDGVLVPLARSLPSRHTVAAPRLAVPPAIDGVVDPEEWREAARFTGFLDWVGAARFPYPTTGYIAWDNEAVYIAFRAQAPGDVLTVAQYGPDEDNPPLFNDDSIELWLRPDNQNYCFLVNTRGAKADFRSDRRFNWNGEWESAVRVTDDGYEGEIRIPFATLETDPPAPGEEWTFNLTRYEQNKPGRPRRDRGEFAFLAGKFTASHPGFATLRFVDGAAVATESIGHVRGDKIGFYGTARNTGAEALDLTVRYELFEADDHGDFVFNPEGIELPVHFQRLPESLQETVNVPPGEARALAHFRASPPGHYMVGVEVSASDESVLFSQYMLGTIQMPLTLQVESRYLLEDAYLLKLLVSDLFDLRLGAQVRFELLVEGETIRSFASPVKEDRVASVTLDVAGVPPGDYRVRAVVTADGEELGRQTERLEIPAKPEWYTNPVGHTDSVLPPWTPVEVRGDTVEVWGRSHVFTPDSPFPSRIVSQGRDLLAGPPRIVVDGGNRLNWRRGGIEHAPNEVTFVAESTDGALHARAEVSLTFEGLNRFVIDLLPQGDVAIQRAWLEIPVRREYVNLVSPYGAARRHEEWRALTPTELAVQGGVLPFTESVSLNDMDTGLAWYLATPRSDWPIRNRARMIEIDSGEEAIVLRVLIADAPTTLTKPVRIDTALIALPVMPRPKDPVTWYFGPGKNPGSMEPAEFDEYVNLHYPAHGHIDTEASTLELWLRPGERAPGALVSIHDGLRWVSLNALASGFSLDAYDPENGRRREVFGETAWHPGEWTHVLLDWRGLGGEEQHLQAFVNGAPAGEGRMGSPAVDLYRGRLVVGALHGHFHSEFDLDAVHIRRGSVGPERRDGTAGAPPAAEDRTLLLDTFREPVDRNSVFETKAERISGRSGETGGVPHFLSHYVEGRWNYALSLQSKQTHVLLDIMDRFGYRGFYQHNWGYDTWGHWDITDPEAKETWTAFAGEAAQRGLVYMAYFCNYINRLNENYRFKPELELLPPYPFRHSTMLHTRRPAQDFVVWEMKDLMQRFGISGLHLDFHGGYFPNQNEAVGAGWRDLEGRLHPTWDYHDVWIQQKRIYSLAKEYPLTDGVIKLHAAPASLPWGDYRMTGESDHTMESILPLDRYRTASTEGPTGLPKQFDAKHLHRNHNEMLAVTLLHNDPCRVTANMLDIDYIRRATLSDPYSERARPQCLLMAVRRHFGMADAEFTGYWDDPPVRVTPEGPVASIWHIPGKRAMVVVSNLTREEVTGAQVRIDLDTLGLEPGRFAAFDAYTRMNHPVEGDTVTVDIGAANYRLVWLEALPGG